MFVPTPLQDQDLSGGALLHGHRGISAAYNFRRKNDPRPLARRNAARKLSSLAERLGNRALKRSLQDCARQRRLSPTRQRPRASPRSSRHSKRRPRKPAAGSRRSGQIVPVKRRRASRGLPDRTIVTIDEGVVPAFGPISPIISMISTRNLWRRNERRATIRPDHWTKVRRRPSGGRVHF